MRHKGCLSHKYSLEKSLPDSSFCMAQPAPGCAHQPSSRVPPPQSLQDESEGEGKEGESCWLVRKNGCGLWGKSS